MPPRCRRRRDARDGHVRPDEGVGRCERAVVMRARGRLPGRCEAVGRQLAHRDDDVVEQRSDSEEQAGDNKVAYAQPERVAVTVRRGNLISINCCLYCGAGAGGGRRWVSRVGSAGVTGALYLTSRIGS